MTSISVQLESWGDETGEVPVQVEVLDAELRPVHQEWISAKEGHRFEVEPGAYVVRGSLSSGRTLEQVVQVVEGEDAPCPLPLHDVSPHETHEWAYLTKAIEAPGTMRLDGRLYQGLWLRLWKRKPDGSWKVEPLPRPDTLSREADGVSFAFQAPDDGQFLLQTGGPGIPWKFAAIPSTYGSMVLLRPAPEVTGSVHPVDLIVAGSDLEVESLLSLMQRGEMDLARGLMDTRRLAEKLLFQKMVNTNGAAVGGYFLLRIGALDQMHSWAKNLARRFEWFADGAVIRAWQLIHEGRGEPAQRSAKHEEARSFLLAATDRGIPLYTEGLRLLRDGLLLFHRRSKQSDEAVHAALNRVGDYTAIADWSATTTTFTGRHPTEPAPWNRSPQGTSAKSSESAPEGVPDDGHPLLYAYEVPLSAAVATGDLQAGEALRADLGGEEIEIRVDRNGKVASYGGQEYKSLEEMERTLGGGGAYDWKVVRTGDSLLKQVKGLRLEL